MLKFDFTKDEYDVLKDKLMLNDEMTRIFEMKTKGYSVVEMSMTLGMSESTIKRKVSKIRKKLEKLI